MIFGPDGHVQTVSKKQLCIYILLITVVISGLRLTCTSRSHIEAGGRVDLLPAGNMASFARLSNLKNVRIAAPTGQDVQEKGLETKFAPLT
jgi:hypothetical protein